MADFRSIKCGRKVLSCFLCLMVALLLAKNFTAFGVSMLIGVDALLVLGIGSFSMAGGPRIVAALWLLI
ncbi:MAG: hypothetical protein HUJ51_03470 [Eggerthellaceae bacterium]|nr:hypothetical protein [Eggerthellaceae bacterium]